MIRPIYFCALLLVILMSCNGTKKQEGVDHKPEPIEEESQNDSLRNIYLKELYYAAPGTNVDSIRYASYLQNLELKAARKRMAKSRSGSESFANGLIDAEWHERGPNNEAGDMRVIDFLPNTEALYAISTVGHLWKGNLNGANWDKLNDDIRFEPTEIEVVPHNGGTRIFAIYGTGVDNKKIRFSDNEGVSWTTGTGFSFYDHWGKGRRLYTLSDDQTLYYLVHTWSASPWGELIQLYKSTNKGISYTKVWDTPVGYGDEDVDLWKPYDSDEMFLVDNRAQKFYKVTHNFSTGATNITAPVSYSTQGIATGGIHVSGRFNSTQNAEELFMIHDGNQNVYKTTDGASWTFMSTASENVWVKGWLADPENQNLYVGGFQLNKTADGINWQEQYPQWWRYYSHSKDSLHVDIMNLEYFKKTNGTSFILCLNHAGVHVSYDHFATTSNLGLNNLNVVTLYDQTTASDGFLYCGAQDKGNFKYGGNSLANFNMLSTDNMSTADGMLGVFFNNDQSFYAMIQNGTLFCFPDRNVASYSSYTIPGSHKPGWINPIVPSPAFSDNRAYVAGGNLSGGAGSYLINMNVALGSGVTWQPTQYNYDFRANSKNGTSVIKAIGVADSDPNRLYVATQDATFFSSTNQGSSWTKSAANLPSTMIPWDIKCSPTDPNKIFICGTGFSNSGVYQSSNGGVSFTALSGSIPSATFYEITLSDSQGLLFAATSSGPYVYVFATAQWYHLLGASTPIVDFTSVDNVGNNVIRFGTYGRGVWDFQMTSQPLPAGLVEFKLQPLEGPKSHLQWVTSNELGLKSFAVEHSTNGSSFQWVGEVPAIGNTQQASNYQFIHERPELGDNYYRLCLRDQDGKHVYSPIKTLHFKGNENTFALFPTVLRRPETVNIRAGNNEPYTLEFYHISGKIVRSLTLAGDQKINLDLTEGIYVYLLSCGGNKFSGKIVIQ